MEFGEVGTDLLLWRFSLTDSYPNMFDYFFKRPTNTPASSSVPERLAAVEPVLVQAKEIALQQARALSGEEAAAVEFILQCQFADARLIAAKSVRSKAMLERVLPSMRNADRRVAKLIQARLDTLALERQSQHQAQECVDRALRLADESLLLPNQVVDLDHAWQAIGSPPEPIQRAFDSTRSVLRERLEAQAQLQRAVIDALARLVNLSDQANSLAPPDVTCALDDIERQMEQHSSAREATSLPKNLVLEYSERHRQFKATLSSLKERYQAIEARQAVLQRWEDADARPGLTEDALKRAWLALPPLPDHAAVESLQRRFDAFLQDLALSRSVQVSKVAEVKPGSALDMSEILASMEKALQEGAVRVAVDIDKLLRSQDLQGVRTSPEQTANLAKMRSELGHLQGWAKWGGGISREELLKAAEGLPGKALAAPELAKKIGGLRERWKSLDTSAGSASKDLWERFDAACTLAYAPAAVHFKKLADERQTNLLKAESVVAQARQFAARSNCVSENSSAVDWRGLVSFCTHTAQVWQRLGSIDRKDKKRLDVEFSQVMQLLRGPLAVQQHAEAARREVLIAEALALNPIDRAALDVLRGLQERWQHMAKALPLERKVEQALWQKFRSACDALFAKRKEAAVSADADRRKHLAEREILCGKLESSTAESGHAIVKILREAKDAWTKAGPVPRATENQIEARFQGAVSALQKQLDAAKRATADNELNALLRKVRLCQLLEQALADAQETAPATLEQWQALPALPAEFERALRMRFDKALKAVQANDKQYLAELERSRSVLLPSLLRFEILAGVESPAELSRERLQMQVEVLRLTLKSGPLTNMQDALLDLCKLAALADQKSVARIEQLICKLNRVG